MPLQAIIEITERVRSNNLKMGAAKTASFDAVPRRVLGFGRVERLPIRFKEPVDSQAGRPNQTPQGSSRDLLVCGI
jgi:hypothetical protein